MLLLPERNSYPVRHVFGRLPWRWNDRSTERAMERNARVERAIIIIRNSFDMIISLVRAVVYNCNLENVVNWRESSSSYGECSFANRRISEKWENMAKHSGDAVLQNFFFGKNEKRRNFYLLNFEISECNSTLQKCWDFHICKCSLRINLDDAHSRKRYDLGESRNNNVIARDSRVEKSHE